MFSKWKESIITVISSRLFVLLIAFILLCSTLVYRLFDLQIVKGEDYLNNFRLKIVRERSLPSTRGNIYDCNGNLLAYNELAYNITLEDVYESGSDKNATLNDTIYRLIKLVEQNGDEVISDFNIRVNEDGEYVFTVDGTKLLRFLADIYGKKYTSDLEYDEKTSTPDDVIEYLCGRKKYGIGYYAEPGVNSSFIPGGGYTKEEVVQIITIRYALSLNSYQKYIATTVASDVSEETLAVVIENSDVLPGVSVAQDTIRKYNDPVYFSQIIGYTGKISTEEYAILSAENENYSLNDYVGKTGIEQSMESYLQGIKGSETIYVDNMGKIIETADYVEPIAGNDIYLTIDRDLQIAVYNILEQKIAGILVNKIRNTKVSPEDEASKDMYIPIDDVYFALFNNNVIDTSRFSKSYASETEKEVYEKFLIKKDNVSAELYDELMVSATPYNKLSKEYQNYESYIVTLLLSDNHGVLIRDAIDTTDPTYIAWTRDETISLKEYLNYAISMNWVDTTKLDLEVQYSDSDEIYAGLVDYIIDSLQNNSEFNKKLYKYMIANNNITGKQICVILWDQDLINVDESKITGLKSGRISAYNFIIDCISNLEITPAQLALDPCSGSCVITDVNTGDVKALVSYPGYDNNRLANSADSEYLARLNSDLSRPLWNYATQNKSAPGSTLKMCMSVAAVEENVVTLNEDIKCEGSFDKLTGTIHRCWIYPGAHGRLDITEAIANSCNCYFYEVGYRMSQDEDGYNATVGIETLSRYTDMFGLSEPSGVEISEASPQVSDAFPVPSAIGQGTHAYTTVGLARYVTAVANSGTVYNLTLIDKVTDTNGNLQFDNSAEIRNEIELDDDVWDAIHAGMRQVVQKKAYFSTVAVDVAGKTGTAQETASRADHALFVGYAPYEDPEIAIAIRVLNGYTSDYAAQITKDVVMYYYGLAEEEEIITGTADQPLTATTTGD
ncbi:MAG: penicillin-binding protein [Lachnospiraceae bacterium]|nr:penicillin-binding protein [Lachnospiraceae bacterium]